MLNSERDTFSSIRKGGCTERCYPSYVLLKHPLGMLEILPLSEGKFEMKGVGCTGRSRFGPE